MVAADSVPAIVSIVVCTRDRAGQLRDNLPFVIASAGACETPAEVIVVDNGSTDETVTAVAGLAQNAAIDVRVVREPVAGLSRARNCGVRAARGAVVLFTDDDVAPPVQWASSMSAPLLADSSDIVVGGIRVDDPLRLEWMSDWLLRQFADAPEPDPAEAFIIGASFGAKADVLRGLPFDESLGAHPYARDEDAFLWVQAREEGLRIHGVAGVVVTHRFDASRLERDALDRLAKTMGRCRAYIWHNWHHGTAPFLSVKIVFYSIQRRLLRLFSPPLPPDEDMLRTAQVAFLTEFRRIRHTPRRYPSPAERAQFREARVSGIAK